MGDKFFMPIFSDATGYQNISLPFNIESDFGAIIQFEDSIYLASPLFSICKGIIYLIRGNTSNRIVLIPYDLDEVLSLRDYNYPWWREAPIPKKYIYNGIHFPLANQLNYGSEPNNTLYTEFPFLEYIDIQITRELRREWLGTQPADITENSFNNWLGNPTEKSAKYNNIRTQFFLTDSDNYEIEEHFSAHIEEGGMLIGYPNQAATPSFKLQINDIYDNFVEPIFFLHSLNEAGLFAYDYSLHPILVMYNNAPEAYESKVLISLEERNVDDWLEIQHKIPLGFKSSNLNKFPGHSYFHTFKFPDKYGATVSISRSDGKAITVWRGADAATSSNINTIAQGNGTISFQVQGTQTYDAGNLTFLIMMDDFTENDVEVELRATKILKLDYMPWNFFYFTLAQYEGKPPPAHEIMSIYDNKLGLTGNNAAASWETSRHPETGPLAPAVFPAYGHCDQMSIASTIFKNPLPFIDQSYLPSVDYNNIGNTQWPTDIPNDFPLFSDIQILWAEWVARAIERDPNYKSVSDEQEDIAGNAKNLVYLFDRNNNSINSYKRFHSILQRYLIKKIPLCMDVKLGGDVPYNNAIYLYEYEYIEKSRIKGIIEIEVRSKLIRNYDLMETPYKGPPNNKNFYEYERPDYLSGSSGMTTNGRIKSATINIDYRDTYQNWCVVHLFKFNLKFNSSGKIINNNKVENEDDQHVRVSSPSLDIKDLNVIAYSEAESKNFNELWEDTKVNGGLFPISIWKPPRYRIIKNGEEITIADVWAIRSMGNPLIKKSDLDSLGLFQPHNNSLININELPAVED